MGSILKDSQKRTVKGLMGWKMTRDFTVSFETNEVGSVFLYFPFNVKILRLRSVISKVLAATDSGTITPKNASGATMTGGVLTHAASGTVGLEQVGVITANNLIAKDAKMSLTTAKATAGGRCIVTIEYQEMP